uniref:Ion-translocating oxidoreductase complex subunit G n=1 Tax=Candidatus Kentrum eta TaxID=2126337 RepID=A0A450UJ48_9GAMM|nr:MAG: electron transport complex protein RnfG [Candidatus Kentron sp. H]VFJ93458.1 MAG: electron transport complex protein RnfG [Candidatus Kentron sp. H]VFK00241.1 MAG: electron transport complex protein RnfG [Candidatus Kentron sp. H]
MNQNSEPSSLRLIFAMTLAGLLSGIAIAGIYDITLPRITANKAAALQTAVFKVLPGTATFQAIGYRDGKLFVQEDPASDADFVYAGFDERDRLVGYAIPGEGPGFQDTIKLLYGYRPDEGRLTGMEVLESRETPGLGDKIYKDPDFVASFRRLRPDPAIVAVKKGKRSAPNEIDAITGATISSVAIAKIINKTHARWLPRLMEPADGHAAYQVYREFKETHPEPADDASPGPGTESGSVPLDIP